MSVKAIKVALQRTLVPWLQSQGFEFRNQNSFFRVRGHFVDGIGIQMGREGAALYLHQHINLLADPMKQGDFSRYRVGRRFHQSPISGGQWITIDESNIDPVLLDISRAIETSSFEFFREVSTLESFVVELISDVNYRARIIEIDLAISLALLGKLNKVIQICEEAIKRLEFDGSRSTDEVKRPLQLAQELRAAAVSNSTSALIQKWADENIGYLRQPEAVRARKLSS